MSTAAPAGTDRDALEEAGVELDAHGYIRVNERLETTAPDVWAMGECAGSPQFTHVSHDDFRIITDNLAGGDRSTRDRLVPYCMFTDPPLAHVGFSGPRSSMVRGSDVILVRHEVRFALDSPLEGNGFELPVPRAIRLRFRDFASARLR